MASNVRTIAGMDSPKEKDYGPGRRLGTDKDATPDGSVEEGSTQYQSYTQEGNNVSSHIAYGDVDIGQDVIFGTPNPAATTTARREVPAPVVRPRRSPPPVPPRRKPQLQSPTASLPESQPVTNVKEKVHTSGHVKQVGDNAYSQVVAPNSKTKIGGSLVFN